MNFKVILHTLGWVLNIEAGAMLLPLICSLIYSENKMAVIFIICIGICALCGNLLRIGTSKNKTMYAKEGFVIVGLSWIILSIFGALPFFLSGYIPSYIDAVFETASGFTTTGSSILTSVEALPKGLLFWRSFTHWLGGMGVLVFLVAILPLSGGKNLHLIKAESPGPAVSKLVPKVRSTAKILYLIYLSITIIEIIFLLFGKYTDGRNLTLFDAMTLTFGTVGTGGFAILNSGMETYSPYVQNVITIFMILCGIDFSLYYLILLGRAKEAFASEEARAYLIIIFASICAITVNCIHLFDSLATTIRHAAFQVGTVITTTGYATANFDLWPDFSKTILVILMFIGACAGSTGGGIKVSRIMILIKSIFKEIYTFIHPNVTRKLKLNGKPIEHEVIRQVNVYMSAYFIIFALSVLIVSLDGKGLIPSFTGVAATINNIGPGLELVGPYGNYSSFSNLSKLIFTADMLIGRLEIFPFLILFSPKTWRKQ